MPLQKTKFSMVYAHCDSTGLDYFTYPIYLSDKGHCYINEKEKCRDQTHHFYNRATNRRIKPITVSQGRELPVGKIEEDSRVFTFVPYIIEDDELVLLEVKVEEKDYLPSASLPKPTHPDFVERKNNQATLIYSEFYRLLNRHGCPVDVLHAAQRSFVINNERRTAHLTAQEKANVVPVITQHDVEEAQYYMGRLKHILNNQTAATIFANNHANFKKYAYLDTEGRVAQSPPECLEGDNPIGVQALARPIPNFVIFFAVLSLVQKRNNDTNFSCSTVHMFMKLFCWEKLPNCPSAAEFSCLEKTLYLMLDGLAVTHEEEAHVPLTGRKRKAV